jgi:hypothetical protein
MLAWEGFYKAKAGSYAEGALVLDLYNVSVGSWRLTRRLMALTSGAVRP